MNFLKYLLPFAVATCGFVVSLSAADDYSTVDQLREVDADAVREFVKSKRAIALGEKSGNLMISGDVQGQWWYQGSKTGEVRQRGLKSRHLNPPAKKHPPFAKNEFDVEVNLMFDYRAERTWASIRVEMDNSAGIRELKNSDQNVQFKGPTKNKYFAKNTQFGSGTSSNLSLRRAYMGYNIFEGGTSRFDVELGRRRLYELFDSRVQFLSQMDGISLRFADSFEGVADFVFKTAAFVVDQTVNHYGYVGEVGMLNIADLGFDVKYSLIDWIKHGANRFMKRNAKGDKFLNSQVTLAYNISPDWMRYKSQVYGAFVHNHDAKETHRTHWKKAANAWYAGFKVGEIKKKNDWSVDANYQWVQAQSIPENDVSGIGRDNPRKISFYRRKSQGFANYKGYKIDGFYALTDNLSLNAFFERVHQESRAIGGKHRSYAFQLAAIYAF